MPFSVFPDTNETTSIDVSGFEAYVAVRDEPFERILLETTSADCSSIGSPVPYRDHCPTRLRLDLRNALSSKPVPPSPIHPEQDPPVLRASRSSSKGVRRRHASISEPALGKTVSSIFMNACLVSCSETVELGSPDRSASGESISSTSM
jgi:hypothetical protein